jgi:hypothetical protein
MSAYLAGLVYKSFKLVSADIKYVFVCDGSSFYGMNSASSG